MRSVARAARSEADSSLRGNSGQIVLADQADQGIDLLVAGSRGYGPLRRVFAGSVSIALMRSAPCPVMVVPRTAEFQPTAEGMAGEDEFVASG